MSLDIKGKIILITGASSGIDIAEIKILPTMQASCNHLHKTGEATKSLFD